MLILTAAPDFIDLALDELRQADPEAQILARLTPGVLLVDTDGRFHTLAQQWQKQPPIFVRHIYPVQKKVQLAGSRSDLAHLTQAVMRTFLDQFEPALPFSVQTRILADAPYKPFDINTVLADLIGPRTGAPLNVRRPTQILSLVVTGDTAYVGLSFADQNLSDWAGGVRRLAREEGQISRAEFKLQEALASFNIDLPARGIALDLGAAPGGWTRVLLDRKQYVTAVDPAQLHPDLGTNKNVRHKQMTAEAYLKEYPDTFDIIVNDMRLDARDSAHLMIRYAPYLYPHGLVLMTLKLPQDNRPRLIDHSFSILRQAFHIRHARHLFHNRSEITIHLTKLETFG